MIDKKRFYVYVIYDPRPGKQNAPIYVGKGSGYRHRHYLWFNPHSHNKLLHNVLTKFRQDWLEPSIEIIAYFENERDAFAMEVDLIRKYGRRSAANGTLCNLTDGGEGPVGRLTSKAQRDFARNNMLALHADPEFAKARDERARKRFYRLHADPGFAKANAERARNCLIALHADPEFAKAHAGRMRKRHTDPEYAQARDSQASETFRRLNANSDFAKARDERARETIRRLNANPEFAKAKADRSRETMRKLNADPEFRRASSERAQKLNAARRMRKVFAAMAALWF